MSQLTPEIHATTILGVLKNGMAAIAGDGQVTMGNTIMKAHARKIRPVYNNSILTGFAGATADAFTLFEKFEGKLEHYHGNLYRAAVELAKEWRTDKYLRRLEAMLAIMNREHALIISGTGDVIEPDDNIIAIGSGGPYALAAARALMTHADLSAKEIVQEAMKITASICIYTNDQFTIEVLE